MSRLLRERPDGLNELRTARLRLRRWTESDRAPFAALNADRRVAEFLPGPLSRSQSDRFIDAIEAHFENRGYGLWAVELVDPATLSAGDDEVPNDAAAETALAGFVGLSVPKFQARFTPCVEIGWRLSPDYWGFGYATEAAREALKFGFDQVGLREIVSFTYRGNVRSRRVMERIGMTRSPDDDFDHPLLPVGHRLRPHVLYRRVKPPIDSLRL